MSASGAGDRAGPGRLSRIGAAGARHPMRRIAIWLVGLAAILVIGISAGGTFSDKVELPGTQAHAGLALLEAHDRQAGGHTGQVVFHVSSGSLKSHAAQIEQAVSELAALPHVQGASSPLAKGSGQLSANGEIGYSSVHFDERTKLLGDGYISKLEGATRPAREAGIQVEYGGGLDELFRPPPNDALSEVIGIVVALLVLLIGFGSVLGAILPMATALIAVAAGLGLLITAAALLTFGTTAPTLALMIGLGVGIDYALFLTTRYRQDIADGIDPVHSAGVTVATSGHAVLVAAGTVSLALLGLYASGVTFIGQLGLAAVFGVIASALAALTLLPAAVGLAGRSIDRWTVRRPVAESGSDSDSWHRYAHAIARRPWMFAVSAVLVLAVLSIPLLSINLGHIDDGADPASFTDKRAYDLIAQGFGTGANGPFTVVIDTSRATSSKQTVAAKLEQALAGEHGIAKVSPLKATGDGVLLVGTIVPSTSPQDKATTALFKRLIGTTIPQALIDTGTEGYVTGNLATQIQFRDTLTARLPIVIGVVVALAFLLLLSTFRSLLIALKAAILNLLSIGAAYGVIVAVFQWGWGGSLFGVSEKVPIESYVPVLMFAIVFGLSMDYEVFLLSRIKEAWDETGENTESVAEGLARTARVITCAAIIMASVFIAFTLSPAVVVKMLAVGLAVSVLIDATIVRLVLVPATMTLFGGANWWIPAWLDRILPQIEAEGSTATPAGPRSP